MAEGDMGEEARTVGCDEQRASRSWSAWLAEERSTSHARERSCIIAPCVPRAGHVVNVAFGDIVHEAIACARRGSEK